jgi:hypothetical protein
MNEIKYILEESDFLELSYYLYYRDEKIKQHNIKSAFSGKISSLIIYIIILSGLLICTNHYTLLLIIGAIILILLIFIILCFFSGKLMSILYRKQLRKNIKFYESRFGKEVYFKINDNQIHIRNIGGDSNFNLSDVEEFIETMNHFFIKLKIQTIIIPKIDLENKEILSDNLKALAKKLDVDYLEDFDYK